MQAKCGLSVALCIHVSGPFRYVDTFGADKLVSYMRRFQDVYGDSFAPCQMLLDHAKDSSKRFHKK